MSAMLAPAGQSSMLPGTYLRLRREASGRTLADIAADLASVAPPPGARFVARPEAIAAHLAGIEAGKDCLTLQEAELLLECFHFDWSIYDQLVDRDLADELTRQAMPAPRICRSCACSYFDLCVCALPGGHHETCAWAAPDLCTRCAAEAPTPDVTPSPVAVAPVITTLVAC